MLLESKTFIYILPSTSWMWYQYAGATLTINHSLTSYNIFLSVKLMSAADGMNRPSAVPTNCPCMN